MQGRFVAAMFGVGCGLIGLSAVLLAGPLDPPAGPVASTHKTLTEVEPRIAINAVNTPGDADSLYKITQPGSYYLTGNITGELGKHGIEIAASGVTIDLMGFDLSGVPGMGAFDGVFASVNSATDIRIRNGTVRAWGRSGINLFTSSTFSAVVLDIGATGNLADGIAVGSNSLVTRCTSRGNGDAGILLFSGSTATECASRNNAGIGIDLSGNGLIANCTTSFNVGDGIRVGTGCTVLSNNCRSDGQGAGDGAGIRVSGQDCRIEGNNCSAADRGIDVDVAGNIIIRNTCSGNATDWTIVANNVVGPILDRRAPASAAISGFTGASSLGTSDPNANFSY